MVADSPRGQEPTDQERVRSRFFGRRDTLKSPNDALQPEAAPPPPAAKIPKKRKRSLLSAISGFFTFLVVFAFASVLVIVGGAQRLRAPGPLTADKIVLIPKRTDVPDILNRLEAEGVIDGQLLINAAVLLQGARAKLKAGEFLFKQEASVQDVIDTLVAGNSILHSLTIPEGWTSEQIVGRLREQELLDNDIKDLPKEGSLMPNTYKFARGDTRDKLLQQMSDAAKKNLAEVWARRASDLPLKSPFELVTLASIVERETGRADERPRVASVFINRLNRNMKLQSDPTIVYGLIGGKGNLGHPITRDELNKPNPYSTYQIQGLPPGPIDNPGRAALEAVANPSRTQELYFVADGTGGHLFAETLDQHNKNVARWRQIEKDAKDRLAPDAEKSVLPIKPGDQKGEIDNPALTIGIVPKAFASASDVSGPAADAIALLARALAGQGAPKGGRVAEWKVPTVPKKDTKTTPGFVLPELGKINGVEAFATDPADSVAQDGAVPPDMTAYPVSATRRAEQKQRAARFGLTGGSDVLPAAEIPDAIVEPQPSQSASLQQHPRAHAFDASEGTSIDPLRNKTFDLNSPKTVPNLK